MLVQRSLLFSSGLIILNKIWQLPNIYSHVPQCSTASTGVCGWHTLPGGAAGDAPHEHEEEDEGGIRRPFWLAATVWDDRALPNPNIEHLGANWTEQSVSQRDDPQDGALFLGWRASKEARGRVMRRAATVATAHSQRRRRPAEGGGGGCSEGTTKRRRWAKPMKPRAAKLSTKNWNYCEKTHNLRGPTLLSCFRPQASDLCARVLPCAVLDTIMFFAVICILNIETTKQ